MWILWLSGLLAAATAAREAYERIGYFWHITDMHYAPLNFHGDSRKGCWRPEYDGGSGSRTHRRPVGRYGDYSCDATWDLIESAARTMVSRQNDNVDFVLWTGDALAHAVRHLNEVRQLEVIQNLTDLLGKTFSSQFVFPALGHDDPVSRRELGRMWSRWLPTDSMKTFESGGYYIIERKMHKLQIVVLNTNLMKRSAGDEDANRQWEWLNRVLQKFEKNGETVYLVGHVPPGSDERQKGTHTSTHFAYTDYHNKKYLHLVRKYSNTIVGQFFGHLHSDTFRVIYGNNGRPMSWAMVAPSLTPKNSNDGPNNPGLRIYKFDQDTGQVFDYTQYYLDLSYAITNVKREAEWIVEYNFSSYYGINDITAVNLHTLAEKMTHNNPFENVAFNRYYKANSVRLNNSPVQHCDSNCAHTHYCAITRVDYQEFEQCLKTAASALASSSISMRVCVPILHLVVLLCVLAISFV